jgi:hypothetical protein
MIGWSRNARTGRCHERRRVGAELRPCHRDDDPESERGRDDRRRQARERTAPPRMSVAWRRGQRSWRDAERVRRFDRDARRSAVERRSYLEPGQRFLAELRIDENELWTDRFLCSGGGGPRHCAQANVPSSRCDEWCMWQCLLVIGIG